MFLYLIDYRRIVVYYEVSLCDIIWPTSKNFHQEFQENYFTRNKRESRNPQIRRQLKKTPLHPVRENVLRENFASNLPKIPYCCRAAPLPNFCQVLYKAAALPLVLVLHPPTIFVPADRNKISIPLLIFKLTFLLLNFYNFTLFHHSQKLNSKSHQILKYYLNIYINKY